MRILVVGGEEARIERSFIRKLEDVNLQVGWYWDADTNPSKMSFPEDCEGVLIIQNWINHPLANAVANAAKAHEVKWAYVHSKFSKALPTLRIMGFLPPIHTDEIVEEIDDTMILEVSKDYVLSKIQDDDRVPKMDEVRGAVQRALGPGAVLEFPIWKRAVNEASAIQAPKKIEQAMVEEMERNVQEAVSMILDETPELVLNLDQLTEEVANLLDDNIPRDAVRQSSEDVRAGWIAINKIPSTLDPKRKSFALFKAKWLARQFQKNPSMTQKEAQQEAKEIFGTGFCNVKIAKIRDGLFDPFAEEEKTPEPFKGLDPDTLLQTGAAYEYYVENTPEPLTPWSGSRFRAAIYNGEVEAYQNQSKRWVTTPQAINTLINKHIKGYNLEYDETVALVGVVEEETVVTPEVEDKTPEVSIPQTTVHEILDLDDLEEDAKENNLEIVQEMPKVGKEAPKADQDALKNVEAKLDALQATVERLALPTQEEPTEESVKALLTLVNAGYKITISR